MTTTDAQRDRTLATIDVFFSTMNSGAISTWVDMWAENARIVVPYPPTGFPEVIEGRSTIKSGFETLFAHFTSYRATVEATYPAVDPAVAIVEWTVAATLPDGQRYDGTNITVFRMDGDGRIIEYHDYFNPERFRLVVESLQGDHTVT